MLFCTLYFTNISHPLSGYTFDQKEAQPEEDPSVAARLQRLEAEYQVHGMRTSVEAVLVVHEHNHPHILMLQIANTFFKLPGDSLRPGEDEIQGLKLRLSQKLSLNLSDDWNISELLTIWSRPNFETFMVHHLIII